MDSRINAKRPTGPTLQRKLGERSPHRERNFVLPRRPDDAEEDDSATPDADDPNVLSPQPRRDGLTVSRERLEDEAGQRIDLRG